MPSMAASAHRTPSPLGHSFRGATAVFLALAALAGWLLEIGQQGHHHRTTAGNVHHHHPHLGAHGHGHDAGGDHAHAHAAGHGHEHEHGHHSHHGPPSSEKAPEEDGEAPSGSDVYIAFASIPLPDPDAVAAPVAPTLTARRPIADTSRLPDHGARFDPTVPRGPPSRAGYAPFPLST